MTITEFRIGNLLSVNGIIEEVSHIKPNLIVFDKSKQKKKAYRLEQVLPIKLCDCILESFGYIDIGGIGVYCFDRNGYEYDLEDVLNNGMFSFHCDKHKLCEIEHLHQLQNIHFFVLGQELSKK